MSLASLLKPIRRRLQVMVNRAVLKLVDDAGNLQALQIAILADELADDVERVQEYGFTSVPHPGAEGVALAVGGLRDHTIVIATDDRRYRLKGLAGGEVALYDDQGQTVIIHRDRVEITTPKAVIDATETHITGTLQVDGAATFGSTIDAAGQIDSTTGVSTGGIELDTHVHGGVQTGGSTTGLPQ